MISSLESAIQSAIFQNNKIQLPEEIDKKVFKKLKSMLEAIRGKWASGKEPGFVFDYDPTSIIQTYLTTGEWPKKNPYALFPTPSIVIDYILKFTDAEPSKFCGIDVVKILEPSAGRGDLIDAVVDAFESEGIQVDVTCCELDPVNIAILKDKGYQVVEGDFLSFEQFETFDLCVMNPPFQGNTYIKHINHAQKMLNKFGSLVAVAPSTLFNSSTKLALELQHKVAALNIGDLSKDEVFDGNTFADTDIETIVFNLKSESETKTQMANVLSYAVHLFTLTVNNDRQANLKINRTKTAQELKALMPELREKYISLNPFSFVNDEVLELAYQDFVKTKEFEPADRVEVNSQQVESEESSSKGLDTVMELLEEISDTLTGKKKENVIPIETKQAEDGQFEMVF